MAILTLRQICCSQFEPQENSGPKPGIAKRKLPLVLLVTACLWFAGPSSSTAQASAASEYQVKAAFIVNFPKYLEWPAQVFANSQSPIVIAILGETKVTDELQKVIGGRNVNGRQIVLKRLASGEEPGACHVLFISAAEQQRSPDLVAKLRKTSVLTVGERNDFLDLGGIINLARRNENIALEVNLAAADQAGIKISSRLLGIAAVVKGATK